MNGHWKPCIINVEVRIYCEKLHNICQLVPTLQIREQLVNFFLQFSECVRTFSELRNDRIPRNPFDRQFLHT